MNLSSFFAELRRRNVIRFAGLYLVFAELKRRRRLVLLYVQLGIIIGQ